MNYSAMIVAAAEELSDLLFSSTASKPGENPAARDSRRIHPDVMDPVVALLTIQEAPRAQAYEAYARLVSSFEGCILNDRRTRGMYEDDHLTHHAGDSEMSHDMPAALEHMLRHPLENPKKLERAFQVWMALLGYFRKTEVGGGRNSATRRAVWTMQQRAVRRLETINRFRRSPAFRAEREKMMSAVRISDTPALAKDFLSTIVQQRGPSSPFTLPDWITGGGLNLNFGWKDIKVTAAGISTAVAQRPDDFTQMRMQDTIDPFAQEMEQLVGLADAKAAFRDLQATLAHENVLKVLNLQPRGEDEIGHHLLFIGPPGTAKTSFARMVGKLYRELGILKKGHVTEVRRRDLVGEYIGWTAPKTRKVLDKAKDGVLFIDEAYELDGGSHNDFGKEALTEIMGDMEDKRQSLVVIMAGYPEAMKGLLQLNAGLASRFRQEVYFPAYSLDELVQIFDLKANAAGLRITDETRMAAQTRIAHDMDAAGENTFGNGRYVRNLVVAIKQTMASRLFNARVLTPVPANQAETQVETLRRIFAGNARDALVSPTPDDVFGARMMEQTPEDNGARIGFGATLRKDRSSRRPAAGMVMPAPAGGAGGPS